MDALTQRPRLLVKLQNRPDSQPKNLQFGNASVGFTFEPLFDTQAKRTKLGAAAQPDWYAMTASDRSDEVNAWDLCHGLVRGDVAFGAVPAPLFAEPDLQQRWMTAPDPEVAFAATTVCPDNPDQSNEKLPPHSNADHFWFLNNDHSQLEAARKSVVDPGKGHRVRIAHLDTGYDPKHATLPRYLRSDLARNYVDQDRPNDASDGNESGLLTNLGHGTGTIGILAGASVGNMVLGGAPNAEVVPIRVANGVVLFYNSSIVKGFSRVLELVSTGDPQQVIDVITMSMGGLASQAWADKINDLYDQGVFVVTAAGNNFGNLPTRNIVFPARFKRVVAACGVMADGSPYADLGLTTMAGNYGPASKMETAISAYSPNIPWPKFGCGGLTDFDGQGTSAATPQIAATAALWIQKNRKKLDGYSEPWMRVEAIRKALFDSANPPESDDLKVRLGRGRVRSGKALDQAPASEETLRQLKQKRDSASFPFLRVITGLGIQPQIGTNQAMLELEALQLTQRSKELEQFIPDPEIDPSKLSLMERQRIIDALIATPGASAALRKALGTHSIGNRPTQVAVPAMTAEANSQMIRWAIDPKVPDPPSRSLRVYAFDPLLQTSNELYRLNEATLDICWEQDLAPGPVGDYIEVVDIDPSSSACFAPVNLNHPSILATSGLDPSEAFPQFHQQMVYAVSMKTIEFFERALGRVALWAPRGIGKGKTYRELFVRRLRIYPHALREANSYYSPEKKALLFGYFNASDSAYGANLPGGTVFCCLSHDVVAHETTHALLDGLHRRFREPTNRDVLAFHEAFADIVALFQHFSMPAALKHQISRLRGDLTKESLLADLAQQFGQAVGYSRTLRSGINENDKETGQPKKMYDSSDEPHEHGAVLVAAIFEAFTTIYHRRSADLIRLATDGSGVLPDGAISEDLTNRLAAEASKTASQVLNMCIRALDFCPPVDITFGDYLRALITADRHLVPKDDLGYRVSIIDAFRRRGIFPANVRNLSVEAVCWERPYRDLDLKPVLSGLTLAWDLKIKREDAFIVGKKNGGIFHDSLLRDAKFGTEDFDALGICGEVGRPVVVNGQQGTIGRIEVHSVRPARRVGPDGQQRVDLVVELTQTWVPDDPSDGSYRGGCTLIVDPDSGSILYCARKRVANANQIVGQQQFRMQMSDGSLSANYFRFGPAKREPFALTHRGENNA